jgi:hypothetical protein
MPATDKLNIYQHLPLALKKPGEAVLDLEHRYGPGHRLSLRSTVQLQLTRPQLQILHACQLRQAVSNGTATASCATLGKTQQQRSCCRAAGQSTATGLLKDTAYFYLVLAATQGLIMRAPAQC